MCRSFNSANEEKSVFFRYRKNQLKAIFNTGTVKPQEMPRVLQQQKFQVGLIGLNQLFIQQTNGTKEVLSVLTRWPSFPNITDHYRYFKDHDRIWIELYDQEGEGTKSGSTTQKIRVRLQAARLTGSVRSPTPTPTLMMDELSQASTNTILNGVPVKFGKVPLIGGGGSEKKGGKKRRKRAKRLRNSGNNDSVSTKTMLYQKTSIIAASGSCSSSSSSFPDAAASSSASSSSESSARALNDSGSSTAGIPVTKKQKGNDNDEPPHSPVQQQPHPTKDQVQDDA